MVFILKKITVEPILFIYIFSYMLINILEKDIYEKRIGIKLYGKFYNNANFSITYPSLQENVIKELSIFLKYNYMAEYIIILLCMPLYILINKSLGSKLMIMICLLGRLLYMFCMCLNIYYEKYDKYNLLPHDVYDILFYITIPTSFLGSHVLLFANCFNLYITLYKKNKSKQIKEDIPLIKINKSEISILNSTNNLLDNNSSQNTIDTYTDDNDVNISNYENLFNNFDKTSKSLPKKLDPITYRKKKHNYNQINKILKQNSILTTKFLVQLFENHGKSFERIIYDYRNGITLNNIRKNIGIIYQNLLIISKILKLSLQIIENNENLYKYKDLIDCIYTMGIYDNGFIKLYNEKIINRIIIKPRALIYNTFDYEYIKSLRKIDIIKKNINVIDKQVINLSETAKDYYNNKIINIENAEYICRHIRHLENLMRTTLSIINDNQQKKILDIDPKIDILGSSFRKNIVKRPETTINLPSPIKKNNTKYVDLGILHIIYILAIPIGIYSGRLMFSALNNYLYIYMINIICICIIMIYTHFRFSFDFDITNNKLLDIDILKNILHFNYKNKKDIIVIYICIFLYMVAREENNVLYLYTKSVFKWTYIEYSLLKTIQIIISTFILLMTYIYITLYNKKTKKRNFIIFGCILYLIGQIIYIFANKEYISILIFPIAICSASGILILNNIRSFIQSIASDEERIIIFIICGFLEQAGVLIFEVLLQTMFIIFKKSIFMISIFNHCIILICVLVFLSKKK